MPYGISKDAGGDSPENVNKMESCVQKVMKGGKSKDSAIAICKTTLFGEASQADPEEIILSKIEHLSAVGKMLSSKNLTALKEAHRVLTELITRAEMPDGIIVTDPGLTDIVSMRLEGESTNITIGP